MAYESTMYDAAYFREKAEHCRRMAKIARDPQLVEELLKFAREFDQEGAKAEQRAKDRSTTS